MVKIAETDREYLVTVPFDHRERAKAIDGRSWDPELKCWRYPKTAKTYDALLAEFGDDLVTLDVRRPEPIPGDDAERLRRRDTDPAIQSQVDQLTSEIRRLRNSVAPEADRHRLEQAYRVTLREAEGLQLRLRDRMQELLDLRRELDVVSGEAARLRDEVSALKESGPRKVESEPNMVEQLREAAILATGRDPVYTSMLAAVPLKNDFTVELVKRLEDCLKRMVHSSTNSTLYDLIQMSRDAEKLTADQADLAHTIRRQRNILAHEREDPRVQTGRMYLTLFASALLWPYLPEV
jgi:hypothetical protein